MIRTAATRRGALGEKSWSEIDRDFQALGAGAVAVGGASSRCFASCLVLDLAAAALKSMLALFTVLWKVTESIERFGEHRTQTVTMQVAPGRSFCSASS